MVIGQRSKLQIGQEQEAAAQFAIAEYFGLIGKELVRVLTGARASLRRIRACKRRAVELHSCRSAGPGYET